ncbi:MAG: lipoyl synthase [candidate division WOR-3 bacterium]
MSLPEWVKTQLKEIKKTQNYFKHRNINTVCETLRCPNRSLCYKEPTATFMILGSVCTRNCGFCNSKKGTPFPVDRDEPEKIALAVKELSLKYVVITSPTRDDLPDGGAEHFAKTVRFVNSYNKDSYVEVLIPDFKGNKECIETVIKSGISVFAHNIETVKRLYGVVRHGDYTCSLGVLRLAKAINPDIITKSGFMIGLGETKEEIIETLVDLKNVNCDIVTVGQYLQPSKKSLPVVEYIKPEVFDEIASIAIDMGFKAVLSGPLVRSSTKAYETYLALKEGKYGKL